MFVWSKKNSGRFVSLFMMALLFLSFIFLTSIAYMQGGGTSMWVAVTDERIVEGDPITVTIGLNNADDVFATEFIVEFDPAELQVVDVKPEQDGVQMKDGDCTRHDITVNLVDNEVGTARYSSMQLSQPGTNGNCVIAYIPFRVLGVLDENTTIDLNFEDTIVLGPAAEITTTPLSTEEVPLPTIVTATPTNTPGASPTLTPTPTNTPIPTNTPFNPGTPPTGVPLTQTVTPTPTNTAPAPTHTPSATHTPTVTSTPTQTPTPTPPPVLQVNPASLSFTATENGSNPANKSLMISNVGNNDALSWSAREDATWLSLDAVSGTTLAELAASVESSGLAIGQYNAEIFVSSDVGQMSEAISVTLSIVPEGESVLTLSQNNLGFQMVKGMQNQASQSFTVRNSGNNETLNWTASEEANWLTLDATSGTTEGTVNAQVDSSQLDIGTYHTQVTVTSSDADHNNTVTLNITLVVEPFRVYLPMTSR